MWVDIVVTCMYKAHKTALQKSVTYTALARVIVEFVLALA